MVTYKCVSRSKYVLASCCENIQWRVTILCPFIILYSEAFCRSKQNKYYNEDNSIMRWILDYWSAYLSLYLHSTYLSWIRSFSWQSFNIHPSPHLHTHRIRYFFFLQKYTWESPFHQDSSTDSLFSRKGCKLSHDNSWLH